MDWIKFLKAWALLMLGQGISEPGNKWFGTADSGQPLVEQIQVPHALINAQGRADPSRKLDVSLKKTVVLDPCHSFSDRILPGRAGRQIHLTASKSQMALVQEGALDPTIHRVRLSENQHGTSRILVAASTLACGSHNEEHQHQAADSRLVFINKTFCPFETPKATSRKWPNFIQRPITGSIPL